MNIRSFTRGDGAVIGAALLLLIASFLPYFSADIDVPGSASVDTSSNAWSSGTYPMLATVHLLGIIVAALFVSARSLPQDRKVLGLSLEQWGLALSPVVGWSAVWSMFSGDASFLDVGAYLTLVAGLALSAAGVLNVLHPALKAPLVSAPQPGQPGQPGPFGQQPGGYGYPGGQQPGAPGPFGQQQPQGGGYGYPGGGPAAQPGAPAPGGAQQAQPQPAAAPAGGAPDPNFQPFWFAVPVARPLYGEDGSPQPVAELAPGTWYLAVEQRGQSLVAQTQDGRRGVLQDTTGIQRG